LDDANQSAAFATIVAAGGSLTNFLTAHADPTSALHVSTKRYAEVGKEFGQCVLEYVNTTTIGLIRRNGRRLFIAGTWHEIPSAGVTMTPATSLKEGGAMSWDTLYYVYAQITGGVTMELRPSTSVPVADSTTGSRIHPSDSGAVLVGMFMLDSGEFSNTNQRKLVRSWFNDPGICGRAGLTADTIIGYAPWGELNATDCRAQFLLWGGESIQILANASMIEPTSGNPTMYVGIGIDSLRHRFARDAERLRGAAVYPEVLA
jgi:hypothetical protein